MKFINVRTKLMVIYATTILASVSHSSTEKLYSIDMTGARFASAEFNLYGDGLDLGEEITGFGVTLDGLLGKDFSVEAVASDESLECSVTVVSANNNRTELRINEDIEIDSDQTCDIQFTYKNGKKATLSLYKMGT